MFDSDNEEKKLEWLKLDSTLNHLTKELDRMRSQQSAGNKAIHNELGEQLVKMENELKAKSEATLDIVGRSDQAYLEEISGLKEDLKKATTERQKLIDLLESTKKSEKSMTLEVKTLKEKVNALESVEEKGPWFDIEATGPVDIDRITKALTKSTQYISILQAKIDRLTSNSS